MADVKTEDTLVIIKPDSFWRSLNHQVEARLSALGLTVVAECTLAGSTNLPEEKWREFYFPSIGDRPPCLDGTSKYMAYGPVTVIHLRGENAIQKVRKAVGATRPWQAEPGTIRGRLLARRRGGECPIPAEIPATGRRPISVQHDPCLGLGEKFRTGSPVF